MARVPKLRFRHFDIKLEEFGDDVGKVCSGCMGLVATWLALMASSLVRLRLYDSEGKYRGIGKIGPAPFWMFALALLAVIAAWLVWRASNRSTHL